jgi:hypothetical protein
MFPDEKRQGELQVDAVGRILLAAADELEVTGHIYQRDGNCVVVAIGRNSRGNPKRMQAFARLTAYLGLYPSIPLVYWNDTSTTQQVVAALRGAA